MNGDFASGNYYGPKFLEDAVRMQSCGLDHSFLRLPSNTFLVQYRYPSIIEHEPHNLTHVFSVCGQCGKGIMGFRASPAALGWLLEYGFRLRVATDACPAVVRQYANLFGYDLSSWAQRQQMLDRFSTAIDLHVNA